MDDAAGAPTRHLIDVETYHRMGEAGIFGEGERIELINGELIDMAPIGHEHAGVVGGLNEALVLASAGRAIVWPQNPVRLDGLNEPQPDLAVLKRRADFYRGATPGPADVLLLVEVADSSLRFDRTVKLPLYARMGIAEYWIVDVQRQVVEAHRGPAGDAYQEVFTRGASDDIALALAPEIVVRLASVLA